MLGNTQTAIRQTSRRNTLQTHAKKGKIMTVGDLLTKEIERKASNVVSTPWKTMKLLTKAAMSLPEPYRHEFDDDASLEYRKLVGKSGRYLQWRSRLNPYAKAGLGNEQTSKGVVVYVSTEPVEDLPGTWAEESSTGTFIMQDWSF